MPRQSTHVFVCILLTGCAQDARSKMSADDLLAEVMTKPSSHVAKILGRPETVLPMGNGVTTWRYSSKQVSARTGNNKIGGIAVIFNGAGISVDYGWIDEGPVGKMKSQPEAKKQEFDDKGRRIK